MKKILILAFVFLIGWLWFQKRADQRPSVVHSEVELNNSAAGKSASPSYSNPPMTVANQFVEKQSSGDKYTQENQLTSAMNHDQSKISEFFSSNRAPKSFAEITASKTPFRMPQRPENPDEWDGSMTGVYKGYLQGPGEIFSRFKISSGYSKSDGHFYSSLRLEIPGGLIEADSEKNMTQSNFSNDLFSVIYNLADQRIIYLKFFSSIQAENYEHLHVFSGWLYSPLTKKTQKMAAFMGSTEEDDWPDPKEIEPFFPKYFLK